MLSQIISQIKFKYNNYINKKLYNLYTNKKEKKLHIYDNL